MATSDDALAPSIIDGVGLFNELQARKNWPQGGPPVLFDVRPRAEYDASHVRGAYCVEVNALGELDGAPPGCWSGRTVILIGGRDDVGGDAASRLGDGDVAQFLRADAKPPSRLLVVSEPHKAVLAAYPFLCASSESRSSMKRPSSYPSCIVPGLLYLGDIEDAANLPRLRDHLKVTHAITALADPPSSLRSAVREAGVEHLWCCVRDVSAADIKEHFDSSFDFIEKARGLGEAVFVHCSRGVSRSASLVLAYLMKARQMKLDDARALVVERRAIVLPNDGFLRCLAEFERELSGERSGVYVPIKTDAPKVELPPAWAAVGGTQQGQAKLRVSKGAEELEELEVGEHPMYMFGRSLTCDFQIEHPSASRQHAVLVHAQDGGLYLLDLGSSHGSHVDGQRLRPHERCGPLPNGAVLAFGASSRHYTLRGLVADTGGVVAAAAPADSRLAQLLAVAGELGGDEDVAGEGGGAGRKRAAGQRKAMHPKKLAKKNRKWLAGPKKLSENERVARMAGEGSGCMGNGEF